MTMVLFSLCGDLVYVSNNHFCLLFLLSEALVDVIANFEPPQTRAKETAQL